MIGFLALPDIEWVIACVVVERARTIQTEHRRDELKAIISGLASRIGAEIGRHSVVLG